MKIMKCSNCGMEFNSNYCPNCGKAAGVEPSQTAEQSTATKAANVKNNEWNGLAIAGFVLSLLGFNIVALVLSIVGLCQIKKNGGQGQGFAIAGIVVAAVTIFTTFAIGIGAFIVSLFAAAAGL